MIIYPLTILAAMVEGEFSLLVLAYYVDAWSMSVFWVSAAGAMGAFFGDWFFFELGRRKAQAILQRFPKMHSRLEKAGGFLSRNFWLTIPLLRFQIGMRMVGNFALGQGSISRRLYLGVNALASAFWGAAIVPLCVWFTPWFLDMLDRLSV